MHDERYDVIKGLAIILMVVGHAGCALGLHDFIYLFHMPVFFIFAGRFIRSAETWTDVRGFFGKKIIRLWWPFVFWSALFVFLHNWLLSVGVYPEVAQTTAEGHARILYEHWNAAKVVKSLVECVTLQGGNFLLVAPLWFLQVLFFATGGYCLADFLLLKLSMPASVRKAVLLAGALAVLAVTRCLHIGKLIILESYLGGPVIASAVALVAVGACLKDVDARLGRLCRPRQVAVTLACLALLAVLSGVGTLELYANVYPSVPFMLVASVAGWILLLLVAGFAFPGRSAVAYVGRHTLPILILHVVVFRIVNFAVVTVAGEPAWHMGVNIVVREGLWWCLLYSALGVAVPLAAHWVYRSTVGRIVNRRGKCASAS